MIIFNQEPFPDTEEGQTLTTFPQDYNSLEYFCPPNPPLKHKYFFCRTQKGRMIHAYFKSKEHAPEHYLMNCHGFSFFSYPRFGYIINSTSITTLLEDDYIETTSPKITDLVVFFSENKAIHSARVICIRESMIQIVEKTGILPLVIIIPLEKSIEAFSQFNHDINYRFYREREKLFTPTSFELLTVRQNFGLAYRSLNQQEMS